MAQITHLNELDSIRITKGDDLIAQLALHGVGMNLAAWVYLHFVREWRLKLVTPAIESKGRKGLLYLNRKIIAGMTDAPFDEFDVDFEAPDDPVYVALARSGLTILRSSFIGTIQIGELRLDGAYFYFTSPGDAPPVVKSAVQGANPRKRIET